ncbi:U3 protein [Mundri virus]|uniref:U3 protein n=1 Tax=Mundri virus TaxID=2913478 RepID=UPI002481F04C|nr:U3 protein [Mundri virus]UJY53555.1 U3 protein [Mundri virus]
MYLGNLPKKVLHSMKKTATEIMGSQLSSLTSEIKTALYSIGVFAIVIASLCVVLKCTNLLVTLIKCCPSRNTGLAEKRQIFRKRPRIKTKTKQTKPYKQSKGTKGLTYSKRKDIPKNKRDLTGHTSVKDRVEFFQNC